MKKTGALSLLITTAVIGIYLAINRLHFDQGVKLWLFGCHLVLAAVGSLTGLLAVILRQWWGAISVGICAYFLWLQLLT